MRKFLTLIAGTMITGNLLAGGLVTNTNQSATWVRMPSRNASVEVDAVYYNPAGLMKLENGFHFSLNNQSIFQTRTITSTYPYLNDRVDGVRTYKGDVVAPLFPSIYAVYKRDKFAISFGFMPIGGGGGATYEDGLPSFEMGQSNLVPSLAALGVTGYRMDVFFEGSSIFFGYQGAVSYKITDWLSVAAGVRYVTAKNNYEGYLRDVQVNIGGGWVDASTIMLGVAGNASSAAAGTGALVAGGAGSLTLAQAQGLGIIDAATRAQLEGALTAFGFPTTVTIATADYYFNRTAEQYTNTATLLSDQEAEAEQKGSGMAPIFSVNITPVENLNIAIKYEMATKLELENNTTKDLKTGFTPYPAYTPITKFPNGAKMRNDMPATLTIGAQLNLEKLNLAAGLNYYFDKTADYGHTYDPTPKTTSDWPISYENMDIIEKNGIAIHAGAEYNISDKLLVSAGYAWANRGVNNAYQSDMTFANSTHTFGFGGAYTIKDRYKINIGGNYTIYSTEENIVGSFVGNIPVTAWETYTKSTLMVGIGLDVNF